MVIADAEQTPKTPSVSGASSRGRPSSPNGASTPWTKSSTRSSSQHDHLKSVWDQAGTPEPSLPIEPFATQKPLMPARKQATDTASPMYPSLNAPSSADPPAPQPLPSSVKMGYSNSQSFSSPGSAPQSTSFRQSPGNNYGYTSPDVGQSMMGLSYASLGGARPNGSSANGFPGVQQGVWSASAFGTGYGYGAKAAQSIAGMDHKAATAFNTATNGKNQAQMYHTAYAQHAQSPQGYPPQGFGGAQSYGQAQAQMSAQYGRGVSSPQGGGGYYQYGAPDAFQLSGRMSTGQRGSGYPVGIGAYGESAGYYGGVAGQQGQAPGIYQNYAGHGAIGQQGRGGATAGVGQGQGARKVW